MAKNMVGNKFGMLTILQQLPARRCLCRCDCGSVTEKSLPNVTTGRTSSCGCARAEKIGNRHRTHGEASKGNETPEFRAWLQMMERCCNPKYKKYSEWGGRGITVCDRWRLSFSDFLRDVGRRPSSTHSLDRFPNNDGNYEPGNVRWATAFEQARNRRSSRLLTAFGKTQTLAEWSEQTGIKYGTLWSRVESYGWDAERAVC